MKTIQIVDLAIPELHSDLEKHVGNFIRSYQLDLDPEHPYVGLVTTPRKDRAIQFETMTDAGAFWQQQSVKVPLRFDGKPNRPLTIFTVLIL